MSASSIPFNLWVGCAWGATMMHYGIISWPIGPITFVVLAALLGVVTLAYEYGKSQR